MDSSVSPTDNPLTMPIRRGQTLLESSGHEVPKPDSGERAVADLPDSIESVPAADPAICPRCGGRLVNPQDLGWCPKCSYCRSLEADKATAKLATAAPPNKSTVAQFGEFGEMISKMPTWGWIAGGVAIAIVAISFLLNHYLPEGNTLARGLISLLTIVIGIVTILCVNLQSIFVLAANDDNMGPKDIFLPFKLWGKICGKLPQTRYQFSALIWCMTCVVCASSIIGGLGYWWELYKPKPVAKKELLSAVTALLTEGAKSNNRSLEESIEDFAGKQDVKALADAAKKKAKEAKSRDTTQCVVVGYTLTSDNEVEGLVVATLLKDRIRYAGVVRKGFNPKDKAELLAVLKPLVQPQSYIPGLAVSATWVKPAVFCEVTHEDFDESQHFISPEFKGLLQDTR
jgi:ATP dependent DNA ligase C terminal region